MKMPFEVSFVENYKEDFSLIKCGFKEIERDWSLAVSTERLPLWNLFVPELY